MRVLIASLFLPDTIEISEEDEPRPLSPTFESLASTPASPHPVAPGSSVPSSTSISPLQPLLPPISTVINPLTQTSASIIGKASTPAVTPSVELGPNPFTNLANNTSPPSLILPPRRPALSRKNTGQNGVSITEKPLLQQAVSFAHQSKPSPLNLASPPPPVSPSKPSPQRHRRSSSVTRSPSSASSKHMSFSRSRHRPTRRTSSSSLGHVEPHILFEPNPHGNGGLQHAVESLKDTTLGRGNKIWIGTTGVGIDELTDEVRETVERKYMEEKESVPVWVADPVLRGAYDQFCKQILWGVFHYQVRDVEKTKAYDSPTFEDYRVMNQNFADAIVRNYRPGDTIWVNDYHLLLVPQMVRDKLPEATIGFFLHIAFPSSEIFRCLPVREELLRGMLGADLIGFQTYNFARHYRQTVSRLLSLEATPTGIQQEQCFAQVGVFPIGIDVKALHERKREPEVLDFIKVLRQKYAGLKIIFARDKLDEIKGVRQKLLAFERFLENHPEWQGKVSLVQVAMATSEDNEKQSAVIDIIGRINAAYSSLTYTPVVFLHQDVSFSQYLALLQVADVFMATSLREGMNLTSHEYVICQEGNYGPLILSEFTGSYSYSGFQKCIPINPFDFSQTAAAIHQALTMSDEEKLLRWQNLERHVWKQTAQHYINSFLSTLARGVADQPSRTSMPVPCLNREETVKEYAAANDRLILLDLEGTLCEDTPASQREAINIPAETTDLLKQLVANPANTVYVMSGKPISDLEQLNIDRLGLIAENGCFLREAGSQDWIKTVEHTHTSWKQPVKEILTYYTERTPGSYAEDRGMSIVWRFWSGKPDAEEVQWARRQAAEVQNHIMDSLGERFGLQLVPGATSFLILPRKASRAAAVARVLQAHEMSSSTGGPAATTTNNRERHATLDLAHFDYVLSVGEDHKLSAWLSEQALDKVVTVSVGDKKRPTKAKLEGVQEVLMLLRKIVGL